MKKIIFIFIFFGLAGCATVPPTVKPNLPVAVPLIPGVHHRVEAGQTLWRISKLYDVDIDDILRVNNLPENATIEIGQVLLIPNRSKIQSAPVKSLGDDFIWPLKGKIIAGFGASYHNLINKGINIQGAGTEILASRSGRVVFCASNFGNFGKTIIIDHGDGLRSVYCRASDIFVRPGDNVSRGAVIARTGFASRDKNNYLHFEIRKGGLAVNPLFYLP